MQRAALALVLLLAAALLAPRAMAQSSIFDPIPDPFAAGWQVEGSELYVVATPLVINDITAVASPVTPQPFLNFYHQADAALFAAPIVLQAQVVLDAGYVPDIDGNSGVHVTFNDGLREIRAVLMQNGASTKVSIVTRVGFSAGIDLLGLGGQFTLTRRIDGAAVLEARGPH